MQRLNCVCVKCQAWIRRRETRNVPTTEALECRLREEKDARQQVVTLLLYFKVTIEIRISSKPTCTEN